MFRTNHLSAGCVLGGAGLVVVGRTRGRLVPDPSCFFGRVDTEESSEKNYKKCRLLTKNFSEFIIKKTLILNYYMHSKFS